MSRIVIPFDERRILGEVPADLRSALQLLDRWIAIRDNFSLFLSNDDRRPLHTR
jgi:hypothetical protein